MFVRCRGSSPLTRGKLVLPTLTLVDVGLIPAHAGKTPFADVMSITNRAHPRSRGENYQVRRCPTWKDGSSPLTRGKRDLVQEGRAVLGLIPAHAGKTLPDLRFYRADRSDLGKP